MNILCKLIKRRDKSDQFKLVHFQISYLQPCASRGKTLCDGDCYYWYISSRWNTTDLQKIWKNNSVAEFIDSWSFNLMSLEITLSANRDGQTTECLLEDRLAYCQPTRDARELLLCIPCILLWVLWALNMEHLFAHWTVDWRGVKCCTTSTKLKSVISTIIELVSSRHTNL